MLTVYSPTENPPPHGETAEKAGLSFVALYLSCRKTISAKSTKPTIPKTKSAHSEQITRTDPRRAAKARGIAFEWPRIRPGLR
jgi:hypothetical protein